MHASLQHTPVAIALGTAALAMASSLGPPYAAAAAAAAAPPPSSVERSLGAGEYGVGWFENPGADLEKGPNWYAKGLSLNVQPYDTGISFERSQDPNDARAVIGYAPGPNEIGQIKKENTIGGIGQSFCLTDVGGGADGDYEKIVTRPCNTGNAAAQQWRISADGEMLNVATGRYVQFFVSQYDGKPFLGPKTGGTSTVLVGGKYRWNAGTRHADLTAEVTFDDDTFQQATVSGTGENGATIRVLDGTTQLGPATTVEGGAWSGIDLPSSLGPGAHDLTVEQQVEGEPVDRFALHVDFGKPVSIDAGAIGSGTVTLSGDGADGATVVLTVGTRSYTPRVSGGRWTETVTATGFAEMARITQRAPGNIVTSAEATINEGVAPTPEPVVVTSIRDGATYKPGTNVLSGTGEPGATVSAKNVGPNGTWNVAMGSARVTEGGAWSLPARYWGPSSDYWIRVTQTNTDQTTSTASVHVHPPVFRPLVMISPEAGDTYDNYFPVRFEGTTTPFATVRVLSEQSSTVYRTVEADDRGHWDFVRSWGVDHRYKLTIESLSPQGVDRITGFVWTSSTARDD